MNLPRFGVKNSVPVNLLMFALIAAGAVSALTVRRQIFPELNPTMVRISLPYPGATPQEVEDTVALKVEEKLDTFEEVEEFTGNLIENGGSYLVKLRTGFDPYRVADEIDQAMDSIQDLPEESENIQVDLIEPRLPVIRVTVYGDLDEESLKSNLQMVRDDLRGLKGMGDIMVEGVRDYEISVDIQPNALLEHQVSLPAVSQAIRGWMQEMPGGTVRGRGGNIRIRLKGVDERIDKMEQIVIRAFPDGRILRLGDIAKIRQGFVDQNFIGRFNGKRAGSLTIFKVGSQDIIKIAEMARAYVEARQGKELKISVLDSLRKSHIVRAHEAGQAANLSHPLPANTSMANNTDISSYVEGRLDLLVRNAGTGALLVFGTLLLFLNWRVAFWVGVGLATALLGTLLLMQALDITLDMLTMFGLILVLGLLVDDAIVVAENIVSRHETGQLDADESAIRGAGQVFWPVVATVLTSVVAFLPLTFVKGDIGTMLGSLPIVVACALLMSLIESLLILPNHMAHSLRNTSGRRQSIIGSQLSRFERWRDGLLFRMIVPAYSRLMRKALKYRYLSITAAVSVVIISLGMIFGGRLKFTFIPDDDAQILEISVAMPIGTPLAETTQLVDAVERAVQKQEECGAVNTSIGASANIEDGAFEGLASHRGQIIVELKPPEERKRSSQQVLDSIRDELGELADQAERLTFRQFTGGGGGADISIRLLGDLADATVVEQAAADLIGILTCFEGVNEAVDNNTIGQMELQVNLKTGAKSIGFDVANVAAQVRAFLFGSKAHTYPNRREDVEVRVRLDEASRRDLWAIENSWLVSPGGRPVPLAEVASLQEGSTYTTIHREDGQRAVTVSAETAPEVSPELIVANLNQGVADEALRQRIAERGRLPALAGRAEQSPMQAFKEKYPQLKIEFSGRQRQTADAFGSLPYGFMAGVLMIYIILAWLFASYTQPIVVLMGVPFAIVGVIWGHLALGHDLTFLSLIGFVALSGIVVNDSLILVEFYNKERAQGVSVFDSLVNAGQARFRAIFLTTVTTVVGLLPLIMEKSFHAQFLVTMAISVAMGLISATILILLVLPCMILVLDDIRQLLRSLFSRA